MGEEVTYLPREGTAFLISGIVKNENRLEGDLGEFGAKNADLYQAPVISFRKSDFMVAAGRTPEIGDKLVMRGSNYAVVDTFDDKQAETGVRVHEGGKVEPSAFQRYNN